MNTFEETLSDLVKVRHLRWGNLKLVPSQRRNLIGVKVSWMEITFVLPPRFCFVYVVKADTLASTEVTINFKSDAVRDVSAAGVDSQFKSSYRYRISKL